MNTTVYMIRHTSGKYVKGVSHKTLVEQQKGRIYSQKNFATNSLHTLRDPDNYEVVAFELHEVAMPQGPQKHIKINTDLKRLLEGKL